MNNVCAVGVCYYEFVQFSLTAKTRKLHHLFAAAAAAAVYVCMCVCVSVCLC